MPTDYKVCQGDCISSVAYEFGFFEATLWNHPQNAALRKRRADRNILAEGDLVHIPDKQIKYEAGATDSRHRFRRKGVPARFRLRLIKNGQPRASEKYVLIIDGTLFEGRTDADGWLQHSISPNAKGGRLMLQNGEEHYEVSLGQMDPVTEISGIQGRLQNLGYYGGAIDGVMSAELETALRGFQSASGMEPTGQLDDHTRVALVREHGS